MLQTQNPYSRERIDALTATLAGMDPRERQQYAAQHRNDPAVIAVALNVSNILNAAQRNKAMQAASTPMPKVVDQEIANMALPEDQGIGQLAAPNIARMADGGIAGYGDGDDVPKRNGMAMGGMFDFAQRSEPVVRMSGGGAVGYAGGGVTREMLQKAYDDWMNSKTSWYQQSSPLSAQQEKAAEARYNQLLAAYQSNSAPAGSDYDAKTATRAKDFPGVTTAYNPAANEAAPNTQPSGGQPPAPPAAQQGLGSLPSTKVLTPEQAKAQAGEFADFSEAKTALKQAETDQESQGARLRTMLAEGLPKTPALQGLEKLLDKQDAETGGEKDKAAGLALLSAGLAIAGGSSQFALQNLKEAIPAVAQYGDALKDIKKMERENMKMRGEIEQARRAEDRDNTKLKLELEDKIAGRKDTINKLGIDLTAKIAGTTAEVASKLWSTSYDAASREKVAGIAALAGTNAELNKYAQLGAAAPDSALAKGFQIYKQEGAEPKLYSEYIKLSRDPIDGAAFRERYPSFEIFKEGYSGGSVKFAAPPANASILKPPKG